jgi:4-aminobutyrate aminotransferase-like enzyme
VVDVQVRVLRHVESAAPQNARDVGRYLLGTLEAIAAGTPRIAAVRGAGLYAAADFADPGTGEPDPETPIRVVNGLRERGVLISATGPLGHTLKIRPPLPFAREHVDRLAEALTDTLSELDGAG